MKRSPSVFVFLLFCLFRLSLSANNIQVSQVELVNQDPAANTVQVEFNLSWENSWRMKNGPANWDAAWVVIKYRQLPSEVGIMVY